MDSPVLKPALIRISAARLIGGTASAQAEEDSAALWPAPEDAAGAGEPATLATAPGHHRSAAIAAPGAQTRLVADATARRHKIEVETARAEARLAETQDLLEKLEREANLACAMVEDARQQASEIRDEARREGYNDGLSRAERETVEGTAAVAALAEGAVRARAELLQRAEPEIIELAFEIARRVIGERLARDEGALVEVAHRVLSVAGQADVYYLHLHPDDAGRVERHLRRDTLGLPLEVVPDDRLCPGDCLVRTAHGRVDGCLASQLREIREQAIGAA